MQLRYRNLLFPANGVKVTFDQIPVKDDLGRTVTYRRQMSADGYWFFTGQAALANACAIMEASLAIPGGDLVFVRDDGGIGMILSSVGALTPGVQLAKGPAYPDAVGSEFANRRHFVFTMEAVYPVRPGQRILLRYTESLEITASAPLKRFMLAVNGKHQRQTIYPNLPWRCVQTGSATGLGFQPTPNLPLFPGDVMEPPVFRPTTGEGEGAAEYTITWQYVMESMRSLNAIPTPRPF